MTRRLSRLADETFDVLVIGGGIYGLATAHELVQRGFSVALIDRGDFGGATSFNSLKTVHGGVRALQHGSIAEARQFVRERRAIARMAPHLVRVLPFVVPTARHPMRNRLALHVFLKSYDALASDRNDSIDPAVHLPPSFTVSRTRAAELNPFVQTRGLTGAAVWHDYQLHSPERFTMALARTIADGGGAVANYVEAQKLTRNGNRLTGVAARDLVTDAPFDIRARAVVNAAGPWAWQLLRNSSVPVPADAGFSLALNLVLNRPALVHATGGVASGRFLFLVPWRDRSILGTAHEGFHRDPATHPTAAHVEALLAEGRVAFPGFPLHPDDVSLVHRGLLPARPAGRGHGALLKHTIVHDHTPQGLQGLVSVIGVRYTTARASARRAADVVSAILRRSTTASAIRPLAGAAFEDLAAYRRSHPQSDRLVLRYGTLHTELPADALDPIGPGSVVARAEILYGIRTEMAVSLADVVMRRTDLATGGHPGLHLLRAAASVMAGECGWTEQRTAAEIARVEQELAL